MKKYNTKIFKIIILLFGITLVGASSGKLFNYEIFLDQFKKETRSNEIIPEGMEFLSEISSDIAKVIHDTVSDRYDIFGSNGEMVFFVLLTSPYCDDIRGFGGNVPFAIIIDPNENIKKIHLLEHYETPAWIRDLENVNFFDTWTEMNISEALNKEVDAVSGATMTSEAVIRSMSRRLAEYKKVEEIIKKKNITNIVGMIFSFIIILLATMSFLFPGKTSKYRIFLLLGSLIILGFWQVQMLSVAQFENWIINGINIMSNIVLFFILLMSILIPLLTNKAFYCQYVCPYGAAQELAGRIKFIRIKLNNKTIKILSLVKFVLLFIVAVVSITNIKISLEDFEPFSAFQYNFASVIVLVIAITMLILSLFYNKPWCRFFCPTGAFLSMLRSKTKPIKKLNI